MDNDITVKPVLSGHSERRPKIGFQGEHSAILLTCIKLPFVFKTFVLSIFEWPLKTGLTVYDVVLQAHLSSYPSLVLVQPRKTRPA